MSEKRRALRILKKNFLISQETAKEALKYARDNVESARSDKSKERHLIMEHYFHDVLHRVSAAIAKVSELEAQETEKEKIK